MQWPDLVAQLSFYAQQEQADPSFTAATPNFVNNAELRIYRELDFLAASGQNTSRVTAIGNAEIDLSSMTGQTISGGTPVAFPYPVVVQSVAALVGTTWVPFQLVSQEFLDLVWPQSSLTATPVAGQAFYTMFDNSTVKVAPTPNASYTLRITGEWRPAPMSAANPRTWLGDNASDILFCAVMVEAMGYQRSFGATADDPRAAISWEKRYQDSKATAMAEEAVRKGLGPGYQPYMPAPLAMSRPSPIAPPPPGPPQGG